MDTTTQLALRNQFQDCRFESLGSGWWDKKFRVLLAFEYFYRFGATQCSGQYWHNSTCCSGNKCTAGI